MANAYIGIEAARNIKRAYVGVNGVARKVKKAYIGVDGVARLCWVNLITFGIGGMFLKGSFTVADGTTWQEFANANGLVCAGKDDYVWDPEYQLFHLLYSNKEDASDNPVLGGDVITEGEYTWYE